MSCGLEGTLQYRGEDLTGIINGVDYREWDPATDQYLTSDGYANYNVDSIADGKPHCKTGVAA